MISFHFFLPKLDLVTEIVIGKAVPNAVASAHHKVIALFPFADDNIGVASDGLLVPLLFFIVLELEVSKCSAHSQIAINSFVLNFVISCLDSLSFNLVSRFVVIAKWIHSFSSAQH